MAYSGSTYLDYAECLSIAFSYDKNALDIEFSTRGNDVSDKKMIEHLKSITSVQGEYPSFLLWIGTSKFIEINLEKHEVKHFASLTSFETRRLAQSNYSNIPLKRAVGGLNYRRKTDFHNHMTGAPKANDIVSIAKKNNALYPESYLSQMGIDTCKYSVVSGSIRLGELSEADTEIMINSMRMSISSLETFDKMERIYTYREPLIKNIELFPLVLDSLAEEYQRNGIMYVELSFSEYIKDGRFLDCINETIPALQEKYGVRIRFLTGLRRTKKVDDLFDIVDKIKAIGRNPYIVGCDFMGRETNEVSCFAPILRCLIDYAIHSDPEFVIRVHAGESMTFKENVKSVFEIVREESEKYEGKLPNLRIGHGLYGVDDETIQLAKKLGATIEFNMSSNLSLNNVNDIKDFPIGKYLGKGVPCVFGTDGSGLYSTFGRQEEILGYASGVTNEQFSLIEENEKRLVGISLDRESKCSISPASDVFSDVKQSSAEERAKYGPIQDEAESTQNRKAASIYQRLHLNGVIVNEKAVDDALKGKRPLLITGASAGSFKNIDRESQDYITYLAELVVKAINPQTCYLVTGGTNFGVEKAFHEAARKLNDPSLIVLGTLTLDANVDDIGLNTITHAKILKLESGGYASTWYELPETQLEFVLKENGQMIAIGGSTIVNDMIQRGYNIGVKMHLMHGPDGASTEKGKYLGTDGCTFRTALELIEHIKSIDPAIIK